MPTVEVDYDELRELTGHGDKTDDELEWDLFSLGLEYEGETEDGDALLEFEADRLDRLSVEGIARSLRYQYGDDRGVDVPSTNDPEWTIVVDERVPDERPYVTGAVVRGLDLTEDVLASIIQVQEKLHATMGRKRAKGAIGIHDLIALKGAPATEDRTKSIRYTGIDGDEDRFVPLAVEDDASVAADSAGGSAASPGDSDEPVATAETDMTPAEVLTDHHTGQKYADLVADYGRYPAIYDDIGLFSFPPVINGARTEVSTESRDLFIEMTGTDQWTIDHMLTIVCYALEARGGQVEEVRVEYADDASGDYAGHELVRPDFSTKTKTVAHDDVESMLGVDLAGEDVVDLIERSGMDAAPIDAAADESGDGSGTETGAVGGTGAAPSEASDDPEQLAYEVTVPPYRVDVLHPVDVIDDIGRAYGFNELEPTYPDVSTVGGRHERSRHERALRDALVGLGFQDLLNFYLVRREANYDRLGVEPDTDVVGGGRAPRIGEPYSADYEYVRTWALPSVMLVLENNTHRSYPQELAEIGLAAAVDESEETNIAEWRTVAGALARTDASFEDAKARLQALCRAFDADLETPPTEHPTFISGRTAEIVIDGESAGVIGEIHPSVLVEYDLEVPVAAFEFRQDALR